MARKSKHLGVWIGDTHIVPITAKERRKIQAHIKKRYQRWRRRYPEVHGRVVDFITHSIEDGTLYFTVRFKDKTDFSLRYACRMYVTGADISDTTTGDADLIREYMRPVLE